LGFPFCLPPRESQDRGELKFGTVNSFLLVIIYFSILANPDLQAKVADVKEQWRSIRQEARIERQRLERLLKLWKEYQGGMDDLVDWLVTVLGLMKNEDIAGCSLDMVESQLDNLKVLL